MKTNLSAIPIHHSLNMTVLCSSSSEENNKLIYNLIFGSNFQGEQWKRVCCNVELASLYNLHGMNRIDVTLYCLQTI